MTHLSAITTYKHTVPKHANEKLPSNSYDSAQERFVNCS